MATQLWKISNFLSTLLLLSSLLPLSISQPPSPPAPVALPPSPPAPVALPPSSPVSPAPAPAPDSDACNGLFLSYIYTTGHKLPPANKTHQAYRFESLLTVLNNGKEEIKSWRVFVGFQHEEILVSASGAVFADGSSFPASVGNGTVFAGFPKSDLQTAIATAGDLTQMQIQVKLVGTQFGVKSPDVPMPVNISLANDGFLCSDPTLIGKRVMEVCCTRDPDSKTNTTLIAEQFLPRQSGDLTMMYDVIRTYDANYLAQVTIANHHQLGRLDNWELSWDWMKEEFINTMRGAYPTVIDATGCIYGPQSAQYASLDFANVLNCERRPTIIDLPPTKAKDPTLGLIPHCCRNGTILPPSMDPDSSTSVFQIQVFKMPPDLNKSELSPPQNWRISGSLNPDYECGPPVRVSPSEFVDPNGLSSNSTAFASWQVVCNITQRSTPRCCVSFSAFYNESVVPCRTCACGCPQTNTTCSSTAPAILLPSEALLVPFENRTALAVAWADINHQTVPNPKPCGDGCGVSINWHVNTDHSSGWTARVTLFNWEETTFADWFAAAEMDKAAAGFEAAYSFNGTMIDVGGGNNTIFLKGLPGLNYLMGETDGLALKSSSRVPGKQQTVISFKKKMTPGINVVAGDGFPSKVYFNGEECSLPTMLPMSSGGRFEFSWFVLLCGVLVCLLM